MLLFLERPVQAPAIAKRRLETPVSGKSGVPGSRFASGEIYWNKKEWEDVLDV
jgi:hypothetical protein